MLTQLPALTLRQLLDESAKRYGDLPAFTQIDDFTLTFKEFRESVMSLSDWLMEQGVGFGDTVAILGENCPQWCIAYFATTIMGAVTVPILTEFHGDAIAHIIRHSEAKVVFVSERLYPKIETPEFDPLPLFVNLETFTPIEQKFGVDRLKELKSLGLREFRKFKERALRFASMIPQEPAEDDLASIIYTSGTTGHSKGVLLTHKNLLADTRSLLDLVRLKPGEVMLSMLPLAHTFECTIGLICPLATGVRVYYLSKPPSARVLLPLFAEIKPTLLLAVPLIMEKIYKNSILPQLTKNGLLRMLYAWPVTRKIMHKAAGKKLKAFFGGALKIIAIGGAPIPPTTEVFMHEAEFPYTVGYGLTETSPLVSATLPKDARLKSAGKPIRDVTVKIGNINVATGEGEILVKGPNVMRGYYKDDNATADAFEDGWFKTGDLGYIDADGYIYIKGRSKNMLLGPSGENIYPEEIESILTDISAVLEALVYQIEGKLVGKVHLDDAVIDDMFGNENGQKLQEKRRQLLDDIRKEVNGKVSSFAKLHRILEQIEPFEKTPTHKIKRYLYVDPE